MASTALRRNLPIIAVNFVRVKQSSVRIRYSRARGVTSVYQLPHYRKISHMCVSKQYGVPRNCSKHSNHNRSDRIAPRLQKRPRSNQSEPSTVRDALSAVKRWDWRQDFSLSEEQGHWHWKWHAPTNSYTSYPDKRVCGQRLDQYFDHRVR